MGTTDNKQLLQHLFAKMATGNFEPFLGHMADDVRWTVMGTTKLSGTLTGKQEVITRRLTPYPRPARRPDQDRRPKLHCRRGLRGGRGTRPGHDQNGKAVQ
jgi:ketosteroid isomerase-like protein